MKLDVSKFYPSVYTHSLVWALMGKERAKELWKLKFARKKEFDSDIYNFADKLDKICTSAQDNQSVGIPTGPDTSHILSEIIGTYIDIKLNEKFPNVKAFRFYDDCLIYVYTEEDAQRALKHLQQILAEMHLTINEAKLRVRRFPFGFQDAWVKELNDVAFKVSNPRRIKQYFSTLFALAHKEPQNSHTIFAYGLRAFEKRTSNIRLFDWQIFESLLLKSVLIEPSIMETASRTFQTYKVFLSKEKLKGVLIKILDYHTELNHHYETVWALWMFKQFKLDLPLEKASAVIETMDNFSILLLLDLDNEGLVSDFGLSDKHKRSIKDIIDLRQPTDWLLYYEAVLIKKWVKATKRTGYDPLKKAKISFYDSKSTMKIYRAIRRKTKKRRRKVSKF